MDEFPSVIVPMSRLAPILILCAAIACGYYIFVQDAIEEANSRFRPSGQKVDARNAAGAGYVRAAELLYESFTDTSFAGKFADDSFRVNIDVVGNKAVVSSLGVSLSDSSFVDHIIRVEFGRTLDAPVQLPRFLEFALFAGRDIVAAEPVDVHSRDLAPGSFQPFHANGRIYPDREAIKVHPNAARQLGSVAPARRQTRSEHAKRSGAKPDSIAVQTLYGTGTRLASHAQDEGNLRLSGNIGDGASAKSPFVWHVAGDLIVTDDVVANGYVLLLVDGDVTIRGSISPSEKFSGSEESTVAVHAAGSVAISSSVAVRAQVFSGEDIRIESQGATVVGTLSAADSIILDGPTSIEYRPASSALALNWVRPSQSISMISYDEQ
ncbi:MAG: hypothetical protein HKN13_07405 [Rhodothermales bacterium]|nr:hypothetical protein [Rhodothermales bacterium]